jgi:tRNA modification GTPase
VSVSERATLVGVATSADGPVAIVRSSGPRAFAIAQTLCGDLGPDRMLVHRTLTLGDGPGESALVVTMKGPFSFTGEDVVEFHVHGGRENVGEVVRALLGAGAKAAGPGDFSRRAFEHGKLSLDRLEGIAATVAARGRGALAQARRLVAGELGSEVEVLRATMAEVRTEIEANLDFPEDVVAADLARLAERCADVRARVHAWLLGFERGRRRREGLRVVLAGPPNAGKSALMNALLGRERVLVAEEPGTTRDFVEAELELEGHVAVLVDTAGLRVDPGAIEARGVALGRAELAGADVVLWIEAVDARGIPEALGVRNEAEWIFVHQKVDLAAGRADQLEVSARTGVGLDRLRARLLACFGGDAEPWIGLSRHQDRAREAEEALERVVEGFAGGGALETIALDLQIAERRLSEITGRHASGTVGTEVLDAIFSRFCIGK